MSVVIEQTFPLGRFQARRWNQPPFDPGSIEWPPSPWRLLRAIAARWFQYCRETGDGDTDRRDSILARLAETLPSFRLPTDTVSGPELRQYQPTALEMQFKYKKDPKTKKNVLDYSYRAITTTLVPDSSCSLVPTESLLWVWETVTLAVSERALLAELLRRMHYFGRAESWTRMRLRSEEESLPDSNCTIGREPSSAAVPVLANTSPDELIARVLAPTGDRALANRPIPPGTAWCYARVPTVHGTTRPPSPRGHTHPRIQVARYALDSTVLPLVTETLPVAEAARRALMSVYGRLTERNGVRGRSPIFSGKDADGDPLTGHGHAYYLPTDEDGDGRLDHLTVFARSEFGPSEIRAIDQLTRLNTARKGEERHPLRLLLLGLGAIDEYHPGPLGESAAWVSATPYVATRHAKTRGRHKIDLFAPQACVEFLIANVRDQLREARPTGLDNTSDAAIRPTMAGGAFVVGDRWRTIQFKRFRSKGGDDGGRRLAGAFRIEFSSPVRGPITLGHSAHFGMGLFMPVSGGSNVT